MLDICRDVLRRFRRVNQWFARLARALVTPVALLLTATAALATVPPSSPKSPETSEAPDARAVPAIPDQLTPPPRNHVLFFDLNNAEAEIAQFRAELPIAETQLFLVPSLQRMDAAKRKQVLELHHSIVAATEQAAMCAPLTRKNRASCFALWDELAALEAARATVTERFSGATAQSDIAQLGSTEIDIVVISGHHQRKFFRGELGEMTVADLQAMAAAHPSAFAKARTVILLGCDTGTPEMLNTVFMPLFPSAQLIIGS